MTQLRRTLPEQPQVILDNIGVGLWHVVVPEASTNLVPNPSFENGTTGWVAGGTGASVARSTTYSAFGAASMLFSDASSSGSEYASTAGLTASANTVYTWSFYWRKTAPANATGTYRVDFYAAGPSFISSVTRTFPPGSTNEWKRESLTFVTPATTTAVVLVYLTPSSGAYSLYIDGVQLEQKPYATTYIDGDQAGCYWAGLAHNSQSSRPASTRQGGRVLPFSRFNWRTTAIVGAQVAALSTITTPYALIGGGYYQRSIAPPRNFSIVGGFDCRSQIELSRARRELADALVPYATVPDSPARLVYEPAGCDGATGKRILIDAVYTGGLEGNQTNDLGIERHALGFRVHLPFAGIGTFEGDASAAISLGAAVSDTLNIARRDSATGTFYAMATGISGEVRDGLIYQGDLIVVGAYDASPYVVRRWTGSAFVDAYSAGAAAGNYGYGIVPMPGDDLLIVGQLSSMMAGGVSVVDVTRYDSGSGLWQAVGAGLSNDGQAVAARPDGVVLAGLAGSPTLQIYDGASWSSVGGINNEVFVVEYKSGTNTFYIGGSFTTPYSYIAQYTVGTGLAALGSGFNDDVYAIAIGPDGTVYAGGAFTTAGGFTVNRIAYWNGVNWFPMRGGVNAIVTGLSFDEQGRLFVTGEFTLAGNEVPTNGVAIWTGTEWEHPGWEVDGSIYGVVRHGGQEYWFGDFNYVIGPGTTTVQNTVGTINPKIIITGPGSIKSIRNLTTGSAILMDYSVSASEVITIITGPNPSITNNFNYDLTPFLLPGSDLAGFRLQHGANTISAYMGGTSGSSAINMILPQAVSSLDEAYP